MAEFKLGEHQFKSGKLDGFVQIKMVKRLAPLMPLLQVFQEVATSGALPEKTEDGSTPSPAAVFNSGDLLKMLPEAIAKLSDDDTDYIVQSCLGVTKLLQVNQWADIWDARGKRLQFKWLDMPLMLQITLFVILDNVGSFSNALSDPGNLSPGITTGASL